MAEISKKAKGFEKGMGLISVSELPSLKRKLLSALGVKTTSSLWKYSKGLVEMRESQSEAVRKVFEEYGITDYRDE